MNDEVVTPEVLAEVVAPEQDATAAPETVEITPEQPEEKKAVNFTQADIDAAINKKYETLIRRARREARDELDQQRVQEPKFQAEALSADQFNSTEAYAEALAEQKAQELIAKRDQARHQAEVVESYHDKEEEARGKYDDFEQVAYNQKLKISDVMAQSIQLSDIGPDIAYYLGSNPEQADRISRLHPLLQAKEIGRLEEKLSTEPPKVKKTTTAPAPIAPMVGRGSNAPAYDTTDPRSTSSMSTSQWIEAERIRQIKKLAKR